MSFFSKIKRTKRTIEEKKAKLTAEGEKHKKAEEEAAKVPYKHVPTHAAVDALFGAPSTWKLEDRPKIIAHNKERSQRTISRSHSTFSTVSSMNVTTDCTPPVMPRALSRDRYNPTWNSRIELVSYFDAINRSMAPPPIKTEVPIAPDSAVGMSPSSSFPQSEVASQSASAENSKVPSSSSSSASLGLKIGASAPRRPLPSDAFKHQPVAFLNHNILQRLHKSTTRKLGEAPILKAPIVEVQAPKPVVVAPAVQKKSRWSRMGKQNGEPTKD
ncbi:hypothetical protein BOTCAL_0405g00060 [Botryotinia calthae]|uniref:Uncharacterized protein n=1 Tax=Botryotinia calthae TaxID=38488 RepID=A0A4Y8CQS9_9HELO|nr:hypothetical protein BOTCAL_0405g00060 [Botryotinia calthae]